MNVSRDVKPKTVTLPNFFIVGAPKAGTTSLYNYLKAHPDIYMSPVKEPNFFSGFETEPRNVEQITTMEGYSALFSDVRNEKAVGEASTWYLWSEAAPHKIKKAVPDAKIIIVLRNPVGRAYSHFLMFLRTGVTTVSPFIKAVKQDCAKADKGLPSYMYVQGGMYYEQVKRYLDVFSEKNVRVYLYDDFVKDTAGMVKDIYHFLGVDPSFTPELGRKFNEGGTPRPWLQYLIHLSFLLGINRMFSPDVKNRLKKLVLNPKKPVMTAEEREYMKGFFREDVRLLSALLKRDLSFWLEDEVKDRGQGLQNRMA